MKNLKSLGGVIEPLDVRIAPATIFAIDDSNRIFSFDSANPSVVSTPVAITGLQAGEVIKAIDIRPETGQVYAVAISGAGPFTGRLYTLNTLAGIATLVGAGPFSTNLATDNGIGMDFNPTVDRIRYTDDSDTNLRLNPINGVISGTDTNITVAGVAAGLAYSNNYKGAPSTTLYGIDFLNDDLVTIGGLNSNPSPNGGVGVKIADINVTTGAGTRDRLGFDILTTLEGNTAFYTGVVGGVQNLYTLDLTTGAAVNQGAIGTGMTPVFDIAVLFPFPLNFPAGKSFTYTDADGDLVTVKTSAGELKSSQFSWLTSADGTRRELVLMNFVGDPSFSGANLTFTAKKTAAGGDGRVAIGAIEAGNLNLGTVKVGGSLGRMNAGNNDPGIPAVKSLNVLSLGRPMGENDAATGTVLFNGDIPSLKVKGDVSGVSVVIVGDTASVSIGGSVIGGVGANTGQLSIGGSARSIFIGGSIIGGEAPGSGFLDAIGGARQVVIGGSVIGGPVASSGLVNVGGAQTLALFSIGGSIIGGEGVLSGRTTIGDAAVVKIGGSIVGNNGGSSGALVMGDVGTVNIRGSVLAGDQSGTGNVSATSAKAMTIGGSIVGAIGENSGGVSGSTIGKFVLGGSLIGGDPASGYSGQLHFGTAKSVLIKGSVTGQQGAAPALIGFQGKSNPANVAESIAVGSLSILGSVTNAEIIFGEGFPGLVSIGDAGAGRLVIGGDFVASSITAGVDRGTDGLFGSGDDVPSAAGNAGIKATIASIIIKGRAAGTSSDGDHFGIVAEQLGAVSIAGRKVVLDPNVQDNQLIGIHGDFRLREFAFV